MRAVVAATANLAGTGVDTEHGAQVTPTNAVGHVAVGRSRVFVSGGERVHRGT